MQPKVVTKDEIKLIGLETRTTNQQETDPAVAKIPGLWQKFFGEGMVEKIPNQVSPGGLFGTYTNYESDHTGEYSLLIAAEVDKTDNIPDGMTGLTIPPTKYLVFPVEGEMPMALVQAWGYIWNYFGNGTTYERDYTADFELYSANDPTKVDIYIAIK